MSSPSMSKRSSPVSSSICTFPLSTSNTTFLSRFLSLSLKRYFFAAESSHSSMLTISVGKSLKSSLTVTLCRRREHSVAYLSAFSALMAASSASNSCSSFIFLPFFALSSPLRCIACCRRFSCCLGQAQKWRCKAPL